MWRERRCRCLGIRNLYWPFIIVINTGTGTDLARMSRRSMRVPMATSQHLLPPGHLPAIPHLQEDSSCREGTPGNTQVRKRVVVLHTTCITSSKLWDK